MLPQQKVTTHVRYVLGKGLLDMHQHGLFKPGKLDIAEKLNLSVAAAIAEWKKNDVVRPYLVYIKAWIDSQLLVHNNYKQSAVNCLVDSVPVSYNHHFCQCQPCKDYAKSNDALKKAFDLLEKAEKNADAAGGTRITTDCADLLIIQKAIDRYGVTEDGRIVLDVDGDIPEGL